MKVSQKLKQLKENRQGVFWVIAIGVVIILCATITWIVVMLVATSFVNTFSALTGTHAQTIYLGQTTLISGSIVVAVIDIGTLVWMGVSAFKRENQEIPDYMLG